MTRKYEIADDELELSCDCEGELKDIPHAITTIYYEDEEKNEIAFCSSCGNTRYTHNHSDIWEQMDKYTFEDAPQHIIEHHKNEIKKYVEN